MFYKMIQTKRNEWYASQECTVVSLIDYMQNAGQLRDAQIDAIKTYLYLKIACKCDPLAQLFTAGQFNNLKRRVRFPYPAPRKTVDFPPLPWYNIAYHSRPMGRNDKYFFQERAV